MFSPSQQSQDPRIEKLSRAELTGLARLALDDPAIDLRSWSRETLRGGYGGAKGGTALHRFRGQTVCGKTWSIMLKILYRRPGEDERAPYYWKREYEVYRSGILDDLPPDAFASPRIFALEDYEQSCWIWMQDIHDSKPKWRLDDYHDVAKRLGRFNGAYLTGKPLPVQAWLSRDWHCAIVPALSDCFHDLERHLAQPLARRTLPLKEKAAIQAIWRQRETFIKALKGLPRTFCHIDAFRRNILHRQRDAVLIDWAVPGRAALGEDLVCLVAVSAYHERYRCQKCWQLDRAVFTGYLEGLAQAGWRGTARQARLGYTCAMTLRGLAGVRQDIELLADPARHQALRDNFQCDEIEDVADFFAEIRRFRLLDMAAEARELLKA